VDREHEGQDLCVAAEVVMERRKSSFYVLT
jgi:hypothetical protein